MKLVVALWAALILAASAQDNLSPDTSSEKDEASIVLVVNKRFFTDKCIIKYRGEHTITNLVLPFKENLFNGNVSDLALFFNQVDIKPNGEREELGQFMLVNGTAQKIFDGRCGDLGEHGVYFGAKDGLYVYNQTTKGADKLGTVTDSIVQLQITNGTNEFYILTEPDYRIYKVNREGTEKILVEAIPSAKAFVLDWHENIYYYDENEVPYVLSVDSTEPVQFSSLANVESPMLVHNPADIEPSCAFIVVGEQIYILYPNGTADLLPLELKVRPTAISVEAGLLQYYALDNNIYEFNFGEMIQKVLAAAFSDVFELFEDILKSLKESMIYGSCIGLFFYIFLCSKSYLGF